MDERMEQNGGSRHLRCWILHFCCQRLRYVNGCAQNSWNKKSVHRTVSNGGLAGHKLEILRSERLQSTDIKTPRWLPHYCHGSSLNEPNSFWGQHYRQTSGLRHCGYLDAEPSRLCANIVATYIQIRTQLHNNKYYTRDRVFRNTVDSKQVYVSLYLIYWGVSIDNASNLDGPPSVLP